jgi:pimeloyl-ACP methyl ester carboxylesterase
MRTPTSRPSWWAGCRVIVPYLRGFGPTRFLSDATPRSGEQAALGADLLALMDALAIPRAVLAGYDWGGRAACVVAALWPERCAGLVSASTATTSRTSPRPWSPTPRPTSTACGTSTTFTASAVAPAWPATDGLTHLLWKLWSPTWAFDDATFERSAAAFDNPDFRGRGDPFLPPPLRPGGGRPGFAEH